MKRRPKPHASSRRPSRLPSIRNPSEIALVQLRVPGDLGDGYVTAKIGDIGAVLRKKGEIIGWSFLPDFRDSLPKDSYFYTLKYYGRPGSSIDGIRAAVAAAITPTGAEVTKSPFSFPDPADDDRFGGELGQFIHAEFEIADTRIVVAHGSSARSNGTRLNQDISSVYFLTECFGIRAERRASLFRYWIECLGRAQRIPEARPLPAAGPPALVRALAPRRRISPKDFPGLNATRKNLVDIARRFETHFLSGPSPERFEFEIWHSFIHLHFLRRGLTLDREMALLSFCLAIETLK